MDRVKVAIIDTYLNTKSNHFKEKVKVIGENIHDCSNIHAFAMCSMILSQNRNVEIDIFPTFKNGMDISPELLVETLEYISENNTYNILLLSLGTDSCDYTCHLSELCDKIHKSDTIIVSAFNYKGGLSIPAAFNSVIGVDIIDDQLRYDEFYILKIGPVNVFCSNKQRLVESPEKHKKILMAGTSISAAYICGLISEGIYKQQCSCNYDSVYDYLAGRAKRVIQKETTYLETMSKKSWNRVALFPFQKETGTMIFNEDLLTCNIENIYDFPYSKHISSLVKSKSGKMYSICNIRDVELEHIDTLVIGHLKQYNLREKAVEEVTVLIKKALFLGKSVFCFDSFLLSALDDKTSRQIVIPKICESNLPSGTGGRLWNVPIPSVAIVGSGSRQGKFTVMARLNKQFHRLGYNSGMISTEPYGTFFGADFSFPYGFCSSVEIGPEKIPMMLNSYLLDMYKNSRDVALMELQSATISRHYLNVEQNTFIQSSILFGLNPDAHVITIYPDDNIELIDRINTFIYSQTQSLLVGILIYPYTYRYSVGGEIERISSLPQKKHLEMLQQKFKVPVLDMNSAFEDKICQSIISCLQ